LKITIIRNRKYVQTIKSERSGKIMRDNYMPNIVWLQQTLSLQRSVYVSRPQRQRGSTDRKIYISY